MKIKNNNQTTLIPRHLTGGLILKFLNSGQFRRLSMSKYYQDPKTKKVYEYNNGRYTLITKPITISNAFLTTAYGPNGETTHSYRGLLRGANASGTSEQVALSRLPKLPVTPTNNTSKPKTTPTYKTSPKGTKYLDYGDGTFSLAGSSKRYRYDDYRDNSASQNPKAQGKPAGTRGNGSKGGTRGSGTRGNARTTAKPAATTFTESPTNITDQGWLDARNAAMQRGWGTYNYNGLTYQFTGDELKLAANNWRNRRKAGYQAEGILNLSGVNVPDNLVKDNNEAREIESTVPLTKPVDTKTTPMTYWYQRGTLAKNPEITREALWQATQDVRNGKRNASYYGESSNLVYQLANANQDSAKNYIYNLWNTNNDVATQAGRKNYTESQGLTFGEPTTNNVNKDPLLSWATDFLKRSARQGAKLIRKNE